MITTSRYYELDHMLDLAIYNVKQKVNELSKQLVDKLFYGSNCSPEKDLKRLLRVLGHLEDERELNRYGGGCFTLEEAECYITSNIVLFEEGDRADLQVDRSGYDLWVALNPDKVPRKIWEEAACNVACEYELELIVTPEECEYEINYRRTDSSNECDIGYELDVAHRSCDISLGDALTHDEQCAYEYDLLVNDNKCDIGFDAYRKQNNCDLTLDVYKSMRSCNLNMNIIRTVLRAGCTINTAQITAP